MAEGEEAFEGDFSFFFSDHGLSRVRREIRSKKGNQTKLADPLDTLDGEELNFDNSLYDHPPSSQFQKDEEDILLSESETKSASQYALFSSSSIICDLSLGVVRRAQSQFSLPNWSSSVELRSPLASSDECTHARSSSPARCSCFSVGHSIVSGSSTSDPSSTVSTYLPSSAFSMVDLEPWENRVMWEPMTDEDDEAVHPYLNPKREFGPLPKTILRTMVPVCPPRAAASAASAAAAAAPSTAAAVITEATSALLSMASLGAGVSSSSSVSSAPALPSAIPSRPGAIPPASSASATSKNVADDKLQMVTSLDKLNKEVMVKDHSIALLAEQMNKLRAERAALQSAPMKADAMMKSASNQMKESALQSQISKLNEEKKAIERQKKETEEKINRCKPPTPLQPRALPSASSSSSLPSSSSAGFAAAAVAQQQQQQLQPTAEQVQAYMARARQRVFDYLKSSLSLRSDQMPGPDGVFALDTLDQVCLSVSLSALFARPII